MIQAYGLCCALFFVLINPSPFQPYHRLAGVEEGGGYFEDAWAVQAAQGILDGGAVVVAVYHHHFFSSARGCRNGVAHGLQSVLHVLAVDIDFDSGGGGMGHDIKDIFRLQNSHPTKFVGKFFEQVMVGDRNCQLDGFFSVPAFCYIGHIHIILVLQVHP